MEIIVEITFPFVVHNLRHFLPKKLERVSLLLGFAIGAAVCRCFLHGATCSHQRSPAIGRYSSAFESILVHPRLVAFIPKLLRPILGNFELSRNSLE